MSASQKKATSIYMWLIIMVGATACAYAVYNLPTGKMDAYFSLLLLITVIIGSRVAIRIPHLNTNITVDDTFVFIALLLYGGEAATLLGAVAGLCSVKRISKKPRTVMFAPAAVVCAVFITATVLRSIFGSTTDLFRQGPSMAVIAVCLMGLVQYLSHTAIVAIANALKDNQSVWRM